MGQGSRWRTITVSALAMIGRASSGAGPLILTTIASHRSNLAAGGLVASLVSLAYLSAELADFQAQRDIGRRLDGERDGGSLAYRLCFVAMILPFTLIAGILITKQPWLVVAFLTTALWQILINVYGGRALRGGDFTTLAVCPFIGLIVGAILAFVLPPILGLTGYAVALHAGRAAELLATILRTGPIALRRFSWRTEWNGTRDLLLGGIASTVVGRSLTPGAYVIVGSVAAGVFAISTQLLSALSLLPLAFATSAFHETRGAATPHEAMERMRGSFRLALGAVAALIPPIIAIALFGGYKFLGYHEPWMLWTLAIPIASGIVEPWVAFSTAALHIAFHDRNLFVANGISALLLLVLAPLCAWLLGPIGLAIGLALTRMIVVPLVWAPMTHA